MTYFRVSLFYKMNRNARTSRAKCQNRQVSRIQTNFKNLVVKNSARIFRDRGHDFPQNVHFPVVFRERKNDRKGQKSSFLLRLLYPSVFPACETTQSLSCCPQGHKRRNFFVASGKEFLKINGFVHILTFLLTIQFQALFFRFALLRSIALMHGLICLFPVGTNLLTAVVV